MQQPTSLPARDDVVNVMRGFLGATDVNARTIDEHLNLFEVGLLDSLLVVSMVVFIEERFGCSLEYDDLTEENLGSLAAISELVLKKSGRPSKAAERATDVS